MAHSPRMPGGIELAALPGGVELAVLLLTLLFWLAIIGAVVYLFVVLIIKFKEPKYKELERRVAKLEAKHDSQNETEQADVPKE